MAYLKDAHCRTCGSARVRINMFRCKESRKNYVDGATCERCFTNVILPDEEFRPFIDEFGTNSTESVRIKAEELRKEGLLE